MVVDLPAISGGYNYIAARSYSQEAIVENWMSTGSIAVRLAQKHEELSAEYLRGKKTGTAEAIPKPFPSSHALWALIDLVMLSSLNVSRHAT